MGEQPLGHVLVHLGRRAEHAGTHIRKVRHLEQALERAVLAPAAVDDREDDIDASGGPGRGPRVRGAEFARPGGRGKEDVGLRKGIRERSVRERFQRIRVDQMPAALRIDADQRHVVSLAVECRENRSRRHDRDVVLHRTPPEEESHPQLFHDPPVHDSIRSVERRRSGPCRLGHRAGPGSSMPRRIRCPHAGRPKGARNFARGSS